MEVNEVAEIMAAQMGNFLTAFTVFLSIATGYLITAYLLGKQLTNLQLVAVNVRYLMSPAILCYIVCAPICVYNIWAG